MDVVAQGGVLDGWLADRRRLGQDGRSEVLVVGTDEISAALSWH